MTELSWRPGTGEISGAEIRVGDFGAIGDGSADDTAAFEAAISALSNAGGGRFVLDSGAEYSVWPGALSTSATLFDLGDINGVLIEGNGAKLSIGTTSGSAYRTVFDLDNVDGFICRNLEVEGGNTTLASAHGVRLVHANTGSKNILLQNIIQTNGSHGFHCTGWTDSARVHGITLINCEFNEVYYSINCAGNGDGLFARGIRSIDGGRCYFPWNVRDHDVQIYSEQQATFSDVLLKCYGHTSNYSKLENIRLNYSSNGRLTATADQGSDEAMIAIDAQLNPTDGDSVTIDNIDVHIDVQPSATTNKKNASLFTIRKYDAAGSADSTARGHSLVNIKLSGVARSCQNLNDDYVKICTRASEDWTGEFLNNVGCEDLIMGGSASDIAMDIDVEGLSGLGIYLRNVQSDGDINVDNGSVADLKMSNCLFNSVNYNPPVQSYSNAGRPAATAYAAGSAIWNTDDNAPNYSDGTNWRDAAGSTT